MKFANRARAQKGYTIFDVVVSMGLIGLMGSTAMAGLTSHGHHGNAAAMVHGFVKQVRAKAINGMAAYRITASSLETLTASFADSCASENFSADDSLTLQLPRDTRFIGMGWSVCVNSHGKAGPNTVVMLQGDDGAKTRVEI